MLENAAEAIGTASKILVDALLAQMSSEADVNDVEQKLQPMIRELVRQTEEQGLAARGRLLLADAQSQGMRVERRRRVLFERLYGAMEIESPYLRNETSKGGARPI